MTVAALQPVSPSSLQVIDRGAMSVMQARMQTIVEVMANVLEEGKDYGRIPGTDKPSLFKPGAEKLLLTFQLASLKPEVEKEITADVIQYRMSVSIESLDGRVIAVGIGECSSNEEKYRWRRPVCDEEFFETPEALRREKWMRGKGGDKNYRVKQIRTSPADVGNTILKMAHKRALIHGTLLATAASGVFNQDMEDLTKELQESLIEDDSSTTSRAPRVQRASESGARRATAATAASDTLSVTEARKVKAVRAFGKDKNNYAVVLEGDPQEYTTKNQVLAGEMEKFIGTDHQIRISYKSNEWGGRTYHNVEHFAIADAVDPPKATPAPPPPATGNAPTAGDIPFDRR